MTKSFELMKTSLFFTIFLIIEWLFSFVPNASNMIQGFTIAIFWGIISFKVLFMTVFLYCIVLYIVIYMKVGQLSGFFVVVAEELGLSGFWGLPVLFVIIVFLWYVFYPWFFIRFLRKVGFYRHRDKILGRKKVES